MSDDDLDQGGPSFEGPDAAKAAAAEIVQSRARHENPHVNDYLTGQYEDVIRVSDTAAETKAARSKNPNTPGLDPRKVAEALTKYRDAREGKIASELAVNYGIDQAGQPISPESDVSGTAQQAQPESAQGQNGPAEHQRVEAAINQVQVEARGAVAQLAQQMATEYLANQQALKSHITAEFSDIRNMDDARLLAQIDPQRYQRWDAAQKGLALASQAATQAQETAQREYQASWDQWSSAQDAAVSAAIPELRDPVARAQAESGIIQMMHEKYNMHPAALQQAWLSNPLLRSAEGQKALYDLLQYHQAIGSARRPSPRPVPQVQRPGTRRPAGADAEEAEQSHMRDLNRTGSLRDAARALVARRAARE